MVPVVSLVGRPDCGKTTLLEKLIPELNRRGYRVGTIKHHVHRFEMDRPGKDTWRHKQAGARTVALSSPTGLGIITDVDEDPGIEELVARFFAGVDLVVTEGYKRAAMPKIEVYRRAIHPEPLTPDSTWIAMVSDTPVAGELPRFDPTDVTGLADFLVERFLTPPPRSEVTLLVDGRAIPLNRFVADFLRQSVGGMIGSLKGCAGGREILLRIRHDE